MPDPIPSPTGIASSTSGVFVVAADEQTEVAIDAGRYGRLAAAVLVTEGRTGELTLTFVERDEIAALNVEHMGKEGPTDVLSFPLDAVDEVAVVAAGPVLLGDVVICPGVARDAAGTHAGSLDDELALLTVHGVLHVLGHDHAEAAERSTMRAAELAHLIDHHWHGPAPAAFTQEQD